MDLYLVVTPAGPALSTSSSDRAAIARSSQPLLRVHRPAVPSAHCAVHRLQLLDLWPNGDAQVIAIVVSVLDHVLLTYRPTNFH